MSVGAEKKSDFKFNKRRLGIYRVFRLVDGRKVGEVERVCGVWRATCELSDKSVVFDSRHNAAIWVMRVANGVINE